MLRALAILLPTVLWLGVPSTAAAGPYAAIAVGAGGEQMRASVSGVNHPTRCDRLLYANPASAPSDAACTSNLTQDLFDDSLSLGVGFVGTASLVSRQASYVASAFAPWFVARRGPQAMASPIGKGRNAATGQGAGALRERQRRAIALLQPLAMRLGIPCGLRLALTRR